MNNSIGIDFGTSNTLIAVWNAARQQSRTLALPEFSRPYTQGDETVHLIPSLIHYAAGKRQWIGNQVLTQGLYGSPHTLRWMKRYISQRSPLKLSIDGRDITPAEAARDFLSTLIAYAHAEIQTPIQSIGLSVPVESFEHYVSWLENVIRDTGFSSFRLIDEPSAAALGYGEHIQPGSVYFIFDFGGGTLNASVVLMESENKMQGISRCRVLGKAGRDIGGSTIDRWLFEALLSMQHLNADDDHVRQVSNRLLVECEKAKEQLSLNEQVELDLSCIAHHGIQSISLERTQFETILENQHLFVQINQVIRSALNGARERGYDEDQIQSVLMIGGSSQIPSVQRSIRQIFGQERVHAQRPMDAIALGVARLAGGVDFYDFIQHDYAIRYTNPETGAYEYKNIIQKGAAYPSLKPEARLTIKGSYSGQQKLGIAIFEISSFSQSNLDNLELVFDPQGYARIMPLTSLEKEKRQYFWMNEHSPTFIEAKPPALQGMARFEVQFYISDQKQLLITVFDIQTGKTIIERKPVISLS